MLMCQECGRVADDDKWTTASYTERIGEIRRVVAETFCPDCGSNDLVEAYQCGRCRRWFNPFELVDVGEAFDVCPDCYEEYYFNEDDFVKDGGDSGE